MRCVKILSKILVILVVLMTILNGISVLYAGFMEQATDWFQDGSTNTYLDDNVLSEIANLLEIAGTGVIAIATVVIGMKYVLGSVTDKASAKENLITLLVACVFFFGWSNIRGVLIKGVSFNKTSGAVDGIDANKAGLSIFDLSSPQNAFQSIFGIVLTIAQIVAILATVYLGVKYIFGGAEQKAKLKEKGVGYIIGIIMTFATLNVIKFISNTIMGVF